MLRRKSKKGSKKTAPASPPPPPPQEELPQVWLPDQAIIHHEEEGGQETFEEEQEQLASYLEREQSNEPVGWEEEEELDYTQIAASLGITVEPQIEQPIELPVRPTSVRPALKDCESVDGGLEDEMEETIQPLQQETTTPGRSRLPSIRSTYNSLDLFV